MKRTKVPSFSLVGLCPWSISLPSLNSAYELVPPLKAAWEQSYFQTDDWKVIREQLNYAKSMPGIEGYADMEQIISDAMEEVFQGKRTAKEALDAAKEQIDRLLKK